MKGTNADQNNSKIPVAKVDGSLESAASFTSGGAPAAPDYDATERERTSRIVAEQPRAEVATYKKVRKPTNQWIGWALQAAHLRLESAA
jgi:hypothetical protein